LGDFSSAGIRAADRPNMPETGRKATDFCRRLR
jgi:hypothetical protein